MNNPVNLAGVMIDAIDHAVLTQAVNILSAEQDELGRFGGSLLIAVINPDDNDSHLQCVQIGAAGTKLGRFARHAAEKFNRLWERRMAGSVDVAASFTEDKVLDRFGGCVVFRQGDHEIFISFAGAPPSVDEALVFVLGEKLGLPPPEYENLLIPRARELLENVV